MSSIKNLQVVINIQEVVIKKMSAKTQKIELTEEFIELWREQKCLWDVTAECYRNRDFSFFSKLFLLLRLLLLHVSYWNPCLNERIFLTFIRNLLCNWLHVLNFIQLYHFKMIVYTRQLVILKWCKKMIILKWSF